MMGGMCWMCLFGWVIGLLVVALVVLAIVRLVKR